MHITTTHRSGFLPAPIRTSNDLECPIHLKVRLVDGTLDVYVNFVVGFGFDHSLCIGVAREGGGGVG